MLSHREDWVSDSEDESETKTPQTVPSFVQSIEQVKSPRLSVQHVETSIPTTSSKTAIPNPTSNGKHKNRKAFFVCKSLDHLIKDCDYHEKKMAQPTARNHAQRGNDKHYARMSLPNSQRHVVPAAVLTQSKLVHINVVRPVSTNVPKTSMTRPRQAKTVVTKTNSPPRRHIDRSHPQRPDLLIVDAQGKLTENMSYLFDFEELNGGYVVFGGNPKGGKISRKGLKNQLSLKVKVIISDNGTEFKNNDLNQFYGMKGIKREFSVLRTPQQNGIAERKNKTLIEAARTMLADLLLPILFWVEAVNTTCYIQNRMLVTKPQNKTPYGLLHGRTPSIGFMRPFGCPMTILNTLDSLGSGPTWLFDLDTLTKTMNNQPVTAINLTLVQMTDGDVAFNEKEPEFEGRKLESEINVSPSKFEDFSDNSINEDNVAGILVPAVGQLSPNSTNTFSAAGRSNVAASPTQGKSSCIDTSQLPDDPNMPELEDITYFDDEDDVGAEADFNNLETSITVSHIPTTRVHKDHPVTQIIGDLSLATQTRSMTRVARDQGGLSQINNYDFHICMLACFLSQEEPKRVHQALKDPSWIEVMQEKLLQFKMQKEEGIDYEEVFAPIARIEAIRLFLAYASFMGFMVYQMDVKSAFLYGTIEEEVYVCQPSGFEDPDYLDKDKYVAEILRKFGLTYRKSASTPIDTEKPLLKDPDDTSQYPDDPNMLALEDITYSDDEEDVGAEADFTNLETTITPESEVYVSPSSSVKTKKHDDKTKREAKGKSHVELSPGYRNLSEEFEDFFYNSINEVNAASTPVLAVGQISTNSTNTF
nr:hypothetical protein [Tanacetum cinerariifolium]